MAPPDGVRDLKHINGLIEQRVEAAAQECLSDVSSRHRRQRTTLEPASCDIHCYFFEPRKPERIGKRQKGACEGADQRALPPVKMLDVRDHSPGDGTEDDPDEKDHRKSEV